MEAKKTGEEPSRPVDISDMGILANSLREHEATSTALYGKAEALLDQTGVEAEVDGIASIVTPYYCEVTLDNRSLYARLGRYVRSESTQSDFPSIVFCSAPNVKNIETSNGYFSALTFRGGILEGAHLIAGGGTTDSPVADSPEFIELAKTVIDTISDAASKARILSGEQQIAKEQSQAAAKAAEQEANQAKREQRIRQRKELISNISNVSRVAGGVAVAASLLWYNSIHAVFTGDKIDAKIGVVPMPAPIEWLVDWANHPDHVAQGFKPPAGALQVTVGMSATDIPLLTSYDTSGAPDASFNDLNGYRYDESKQGLYNSDFSADYHNILVADSGSAEFNDSGCYDIRGNYADGKTSIFTQTVGVNNMVTFSIPDIHTLKICKLNGAPSDFKGSIYLYQNKSV